MDRFLQCSTLSCIWDQQKVLDEQALCGDPNAQYTLSFLYVQ